jgi:hypothetical protein
MIEAQSVEQVSRPLAMGLGLVAVTLSATAALLFAALILQGLTGGHLWTDSVLQMIFPFMLALKAIAIINLVYAVQFMSQRRWAPFIRFLWLSLLALVLVVVIGMFAFV